MKTTLVLITSMLLFASIAGAQQQSGVPQPANSASDSSQSTIQGCLMGSETTSTYVVTDEHTGIMYLLQGSEFLLKPAVGREVMLTGTARPIRPSDRKGSLGYISPNQPNRTGDTSSKAGQKAFNFAVTHIQPVADNCAQQSESQKSAMATSQAVLGKVRSQNGGAKEPEVGQTAQAQQGTSQTGMATGTTTPSVPATGKTGNKGSALPVTTTGSAGHVTPGVETQAGKAQAPGRQTGLEQGGVAQHPTAAPGAPPTPEQAGQNPADAERIASSAQRAEVNNSQHQLGVNAQPNYQQNAQQQTARANQPVAAPNREQNRNPQHGTELPGASQQMESGRRERQQQAEEHQQAQPTLIGCLSSSEPSTGEFFLTEQKSGTRHGLNASREQLKDHLNHLVEVTGKPANEASSKSVAGNNNEAGFFVTAVQDLAPTCGARR